MGQSKKPEINQEDADKIHAELAEKYGVQSIKGGRSIKYSFSPVLYKYLLSVLKKQLGSFKGKDILELGYMGTSILEYLKEKGANAHGFQNRPPHQAVDGIEFEEGFFTDLEKHFGNKKFDSIISSRVFEVNAFEKNDSGHSALDQTIQSYKSINKKLKLGGFFIIQIDYKGQLLGEDHLARLGFKPIAAKKNISGILELLVLKKVGEVK